VCQLSVYGTCASQGCVCFKGISVGTQPIMFLLHSPRWSVDAGVRNRQDPDFVTKDLWLLDKMQDVCQAAGFDNPLPTYVSQYKRAKELGECQRIGLWAPVKGSSLPAVRCQNAFGLPTTTCYVYMHPMLTRLPHILHDC
jgi:hypothetical protein